MATGSTPFFSAFPRKMSAKEGATIARKPHAASAHGACSRDDPQPKLRPARRILAPSASGSSSAKSSFGDPSAL